MANIPRRMKRFYRQTGAELPEEQQKKERKEASFRQDLNSKMPTIRYEDLPTLDKKNFNELRMIQAKNLEEKLALMEIEKFKKEKKRMPNKSEAEQIAENIFAQLKNSDIYEEKEPPVGQEGPRRLNRGRRREREERKRANEEDKNNLRKTEGSAQAPIQSSNVINVKDLFKDDSTGEEEIHEGDEFSLDLNLEEKPKSKKTGKEKKGKSNDEEIEKMEEDDTDKIKCPNCKKVTQKVLYCPKCGKAFCGNCGNKNKEGKVTCPKCGEKFRN